MKNILVFVSSLDGRVTRWEETNVKSWSSRSDQEYFRALWGRSHLIVMGINTFLADPVKPSDARLLIVMTTHPGDFSRYQVPGQVEFTAETPGNLTGRLGREGYDQLLVVGGPKIAASFLRENLIDEVWLTTEPRIFGEGKNMAMGEKLDISLKLISCEIADLEGTTITKYSVVK
jgi:dihydrofolate reductase